MFKALPKLLFIYIAFIFFTLITHAQTELLSNVKDTLVVGVAGSEPFVFEEINKGIAVEIWDEIADKKSWNYKYVPFENVEEALHHLNIGDLDIIVVR